MFICRQFEQFWGGSKSFYQDVWSYFYRDIFNGSKFLVSTIGKHKFLFIYNESRLCSLFYFICFVCVLTASKRKLKIS